MSFRLRGKGRLAEILILLAVIIAVFHTLTVNVNAASPKCYASISLTVSDPTGPVPFSPHYDVNYYYCASPYRVTMYWGDGSSDDLSSCSDSNCPSHTYYTPGTYTMNVVIVDGTGGSASDSATITAYSSAYTEYTTAYHSVGASFTVTLYLNPLSGQAPFTPRWSGSRSAGGVAPFDSVIYWGDGTSNDITNCDPNCPQHTYYTPGTYTITLTVTDSTGASASDSKTITVYGAPISTPTSTTYSLSVSLTVTTLSGQAPFTPTWSFTTNGGQAPLKEVMFWGDGTSDDVSTCTTNCPSHTYNSPGTYTMQVTVTDSAGNTASDSKTITVYSSAATTPAASTSTQGPVLIPAITACDPALTIVALVITILVAVAVAVGVVRWIVTRRPLRTRLIIMFIVAVVVWFFVGALIIGGPATVCNPGVVWLLAILVIIATLVFLRDWILGPIGPPPPPPSRLNVTGNATVTKSGGGRTPLTKSNLPQVGPGSSIETQKASFVRLQTPLGSRSETTIGEDSVVGWLDSTLRQAISWLRLPGPGEVYNLERTLLRLDFGKFLLNWVEPAAEKEALIILPAGLITAGASEAARRWLARVKGTMVLFEAVPDGTGAAITVLEGDDPTKPSSVELWRSDDLKVIQINPGERVIITTNQPPTKTSLALARGLTWDIEDPFRILHKYWSLPPMSPGTTAALTGEPRESDHTPTPQETQFCTNCAKQIPRGVKYCPYCAAEQPKIP